MKKVILTIAGMLWISLAVVSAQADTTRKGNPPQQGQPTTTQPPLQYQQPNEYRSDDRIKVEPDQIPSSLRQTLKDKKYKGWEQATIYRDRSTNEYSLDIIQGDSTRTYRFNSNGKPIRKN